MIDADTLRSIDKNDIHAISERLEEKDLAFLAGCLAEKDDKIRYPAFLLMQTRSLYHKDVYPFWDLFVSKLKSDNSFQRTIGFTLMAANARWDDEKKLDAELDAYLAFLGDDKPITVRLGIQSLLEVVPYKEALLPRIADRLMGLNLGGIRETMRKLVFRDILQVLSEIRTFLPDERIERYIREKDVK